MKPDCDCGAPWDVPCLCAMDESETHMKLDTATDILEWAEYGRTVSVTIGTGGQIHRPDTETAERLAYCVRVTEIVEREACKPFRCQVACKDCDVADTCSDILKEAAQKEGK